MKPIAANIRLSLKNEAHSGEDFISLSETLYQQNLIYAEPRELRRKGDTLELSVIFRDRTAFDHWITHEAVQSHWVEKFEALLVHAPTTSEERDVIVEVDKVANCPCEHPTFYILQGRSVRFMDELTCGNCLKQIPFSRIPLEIKLEDWQVYHQRFYMNWLESGMFEQEALAELTNYKAGKLNRAGEKIRAELSRHFDAPVYIRYFLEGAEDPQLCLLCAKPGIDSGLEKLGKLCLDCHTIFA